jgi:hypothetical protein
MSVEKKFVRWYRQLPSEARNDLREFLAWSVRKGIPFERALQDYGILEYGRYAGPVETDGRYAGPRDRTKCPYCGKRI